jgi:hypothetical protein
MLLVIDTITWKPHLETAMEVAIERHREGERVLFCSLRDGLPACEDRAVVHALADLPATRIRRAGEILRREGVEFRRAEYTGKERCNARTAAAAMMRSVADNDALKALRYGDFHDIGWGALSSAMSVTRNSLVDATTHRRLLRRYLEASILVYERVRQLIDAEKPDEVLLFNGRFATTRAAMRAAQSRAVRWTIHERGGDKSRYWLTDCIPHDMARIQEKILAGWREDLAEAGTSFFQSRRDRVERAWHSFTRGQQVGRLPPEMDDGSDWIAFFTTSEDEMLSIGDCNANARYPTQVEAIEAVARAVRALPGTRLCVRVHPHTSLKHRADREKWARLDLPGVLLIGPDDPTDSYALIERAKVVCTYGSTVGVEATYWGKPSLLFGKSFYDRLEVCTIAEGPEQVLEFLRHPTTQPRERTLKYGAHWSLLGQPYRLYKAENLHRGSILGTYLDDTPTILSAKRLAGVSRRLFGRS